MCGTGSIGQSAGVNQGNSAQVGGSMGGGDTPGSIEAILKQLVEAVTALTQALGGANLIGGGGTSTAVDDANGGADEVDNSGTGGSKMVGPDGKPLVGGDNGGDIKQIGPDGKPIDDPVVDPPVGTPLDVAQGKADKAAQALTDAKVKQADADDDVAVAKSNVEKADKAVTDARTKSIDADKALVDAGAAVTAARAGHGEYTTGASETLANVASKYNVTVAKLRELNPSITVEGSLPAGTKVKLPKGIGTEALVAAAEAKVVEARTASTAARRALDDAIAAAAAAREALRAAEQAAEAAKKAVEDAQKAVDEANKAVDTEKTKEADAAKQKQHEADKTKMLEEVAAAKDKSFDERNKIFQGYFSKETDNARRQDLFVSFVNTLSEEEKTKVFDFLKSQSAA